MKPQARVAFVWCVLALAVVGGQALAHGTRKRISAARPREQHMVGVPPQARSRLLDRIVLGKDCR